MRHFGFIALPVLSMGKELLGCQPEPGCDPQSLLDEGGGVGDSGVEGRSNLIDRGRISGMANLIEQLLEAAKLLPPHTREAAAVITVQLVLCAFAAPFHSWRGLPRPVYRVI